MEKSRKMNVVLTVIIIIMALIIGLLVWQSLQINGELQELTFVEGETQGNIVTVKNDWLAYDSISFNELIDGTELEKVKVSYYFSDFFESNLVKAMHENYFKLTYSKTVIIDSDKTFYLVGDYFITSPDTKKPDTNKK